MNIEAVKMNDLLSEEHDIYKTVMIVANRARQIIDKRYLEQVDLEDIEDSDQLIELSKEDFDKDKPIMKAYSEFLNNELEWTSGEKLDESEDS